MKSKYALDPEFHDIKDSKAANSSTFILKLGNMILRRQTSRVKADGIPVKKDSYRIKGYRGKDINVRVFSPENAVGELPCIVNFHGGAFVGEGMPHQIRYCLYFAEHVNCRVVFVNYTVALKMPFPTPVEDCFSSLLWVFDNAKMLGVDPSRVAVFGDSAGGALAAAVCQMTRDRGKEMPCFQMLIYPVTDSSQSSQSVKKYHDTPTFNSHGNKVMWDYYLKNGDFGTPQYAAPLLAECFDNLPPAYVEVAQFDCLHDEGVEYARKLQEAGVKTELREMPGSFHGYDIQDDREYSKKALAYRGEVFKKVFF